MLKAKRTFRLPSNEGTIHAGDLTTPALALKYLNDPDKLKRVQACIALGALKDKSTLPNLLRLLKKEEDAQVRQNAVKSLGLLADHEALPVLQTISTNHKEAYYVRNEATQSIDQILLLDPSPTHSASTNSPPTSSQQDTQLQFTPASQLSQPQSSQSSQSPLKPAKSSQRPSLASQSRQPQKTKQRQTKSTTKSKSAPLDVFFKPSPNKKPKTDHSPLNLPTNNDPPVNNPPPQVHTIVIDDDVPDFLDDDNSNHIIKASTTKNNSTNYINNDNGNNTDKTITNNGYTAKFSTSYSNTTTNFNFANNCISSSNPTSNNTNSNINFNNNNNFNHNLNNNNFSNSYSNNNTNFSNGKNTQINTTNDVKNNKNSTTTTSFLNKPLAVSSFSKHPSISLTGGPPTTTKTATPSRRNEFASASTQRSPGAQRAGSNAGSSQSLYASSFAKRDFGAQSSGAQSSGAVPAVVKKGKKRAAPPSDPKSTVKLSAEQEAVLQLAIDGHSFFFTGSAGTGKSLLLREIVRTLRAIHGSECVHVTASTGVAACNIGGVTIHSFSGMGLATDDPATLARRACDNRNTRARWTEAKSLLIDEVSMLSGDFFGKLEYVARAVREDDRPFGGLQVILCGDFFQLPPVTSGEPNFCFEAGSWKVAMRRCVELRSVYRQKDQQFVDILNEARRGDVSSKSLATLMQCRLTKLSSDDGIEPTRLYSRRKDVEEENLKFLRNLPGASVKFKAIDQSKNDYFLQQLQKNCTAPEISELKLGAQVILIKNLDVEQELVNGARGVVVDWKDADEEEAEEFPGFKVFPVVRFSSGVKRTILPAEWNVAIGGEKMATRWQIPLSLAWALSIHKSQGMTIDKLEISLGEVFEWGQAYVALSRATSMHTLKILGDFDVKVIRTHPKVVQFHQECVRGVFS